MRVLLAGGGTGGHLVPGLNLAAGLKERGHVPALVREGREVEERFPFDGEILEDMGLRAGSRGAALAFDLWRGGRKALRLLREWRPDLVAGLGGRTAFPCLRAAGRLGIPFVLLEQNRIPGRTTRWFARRARRVYLAFPETAELLPGASNKATGPPLRPGLDRREDPGLRRRFGLAPGRRILLVLGGSQGALALNEGLPRLLAALPKEWKEGWAVLHLAGSGKEEASAKAYEGTGVDAHVLPFHREMPELYALASLVVCRGGGTTLAEVAAAGRPALVVPYPWHRDRHQEANAACFEERGAMRILPQSELEAGGGRELLLSMTEPPGLLEEMGARARRVLPPGGRARILADLESLFEGSGRAEVSE